jgi:hypothetical protein
MAVAMTDHFSELRQKALRWLPPALLREMSEEGRLAASRADYDPRPIVKWVEAAAWLLSVVQQEFEGDAGRDLTLSQGVLPAYERIRAAFREWLRGINPSDLVGLDEVLIALSKVPTTLFGTRLGIEVAIQALLMRKIAVQRYRRRLKEDPGPASVDVRVQEQERTFKNESPFILGRKKALLGRGATLGGMMSMRSAKVIVSVDIHHWPLTTKLASEEWAEVWNDIYVLTGHIAGDKCVLRLTLPASASASMLSKSGVQLGRGFTLGGGRMSIS